MTPTGIQVPPKTLPERPGARPRPGGIDWPERAQVALFALWGLVAVGLSTVFLFASTGRSFGVPHHGLGPPTWVVGPLAHSASTMTAARFFLLLAAMWVFYLVVVALAAEIPPRAALAAILVLTGAFTIGPVLLSTDAFSYIDYGRLGAIHHLNPYLHGPAAAPHDPVFPFVNWRHTPSIYGPLFTLLTYAIVPFGLGFALWSLKLVTGLASLALVWLVWRTAKRVGAPPVPAALFVGLNPILLVFGVGGAHNDVLALALAVAAAALVLERREALGGALLVGAFAIKATAGSLFPFVFLGARRRWALLAGCAAAAALVVAVGAVVFGGHVLEPFKLVAKHEHLYFPQSIPPHLADLVGAAPASTAVRLTAELVAIAAVAALIWRCFRRPRSWLREAGFAEFALLVGTTWLLPWYTIWVLPFAALAKDRRLIYAALALGTFVVASHAYYMSL